MAAIERYRQPGDPVGCGWSINDAEVAFREVAGLGVAMRRGDFFELSGTALELFRAIRDCEATDVALASILVDAYGISPVVAYADVRDFLTALDAAGLAIGPDSGVRTVELATAPSLVTKSPVCWEIARQHRIPLKCKLDVTHRCTIARK